MFKYRLARLLRFHEAALVPLREALAQAQTELRLAELARDTARAETHSCEQALAALPANGEVYLAALSFARELHLRCREREQAVLTAEKHVADAISAVNEARSRILQLEKHRERQWQAYRQQEQKRTYLAADEAWLQRLRTGEGDELRFDR
jgi:ribosome-associated translation inhibitor RaiA